MLMVTNANREELYMAPKLRRELLQGVGALEAVKHNVPPNTLLRFRDLRERRIVENWPTLLRWIEREGFPAGIRLGPNCRAWESTAVADWLEGRRIPAPARQPEQAAS
jgi:predicted DNA-binding transcriptional regulator AlpA